LYPIGNSAAAPVLEPAPETATVEQPRPFPAGPARQAPLFDDRPKIIPFESFAPQRTPRRRAPVTREGQLVAQAAATRIAQQPLDLRSPAPREKTAVHDDSPAAMPAVRLSAAMLDAGFLFAGMAAAAAAYCLMGGQFVLAGRAIVPYVAVAGALTVFYHLFWCVLGTETAGMRCLGLRVLTFDGLAPTWQRRVGRFVLACFGLGAVGIGLLWALIDDENLTWHDHISKTFPTEYDPNPGTFRRR
jgi:uncharacterized RDD family membrane protein YckC